MRFGATPSRSREQDPRTLLAVAVGRAVVADLHDRHYAGDTRRFLPTHRSHVGESNNLRATFSRNSDPHARTGRVSAPRGADGCLLALRKETRLCQSSRGSCSV
jgi:hypothetical protein